MNITSRQGVDEYPVPRCHPYSIKKTKTKTNRLKDILILSKSLII